MIFCLLQWHFKGIVTFRRLNPFILSLLRGTCSPYKAASSWRYFICVFCCQLLHTLILLVIFFDFFRNQNHLRILDRLLLVNKELLASRRFIATNNPFISCHSSLCSKIWRTQLLHMSIEPCSVHQACWWAVTKIH